MKLHHLSLAWKPVALGLSATVLLSSPSWGKTIVGSAHDLSTMMNSGGQVCVACHTPHNAQTGSTTPLWNHASTTATFTMYTSSTMKAVAAGQPTSYSKACLSCHDGTVALDSFGGKTGTAGTMGGAEKLGSDLSDDHPISITYDTTLATANGGLVTPASTAGVDASKTIPLFAGKLECATCHNAHDNANGSFLRKSNAGSALCLSCHTK